MIAIIMTKVVLTLVAILLFLLCFVGEHLLVANSKRLSYITKYITGHIILGVAVIGVLLAFIGIWG